ncbi:MAG: sugar ABC transporter ATP-binding protein [Sedimentibacter sp.]
MTEANLSPQPNDSEIILALKNITKCYPGVVALDDVSIDFKKGEVHALVGENGAGKSTMIKTIAGAITPDKGSIIFEGQEYITMTPAISRSLGIEVVYQEYNLIGPLSAAENICFGEKHGKFVNNKLINKKAKALFDQFRVDINPNTPVRDLASAQRQIVEIAKAVSKDAKVLILDEPTAPLTVSESERLFEIISMLKSKGVTIVYISHRLDEIFRISDRVSVMRDGKYIKTLNISETNKHDLITCMVGRELSDTYPTRKNEIGEVVLRAENICTDVIKEVSFEVRKGEILGVSGLVGSGRTEMARAIFGADKKKCGNVYVNGKKVNACMPKHAISFGIGLIPEDRKRQGVFLEQSITWNCSIVNIKNISNGLVVDSKKEVEIATYYKNTLGIKTPSLNQQVKNLSGGNQQKVVIAKTLAADSSIIFFDEPTRGIDVGARYEIYLLMNKLAEEGKCIIMISSDMEELLGMSDRIIVFSAGILEGELKRSEFDQNLILELSSKNLNNNKK